MTTLAAPAPRHPFRLALPAAAAIDAPETPLSETLKAFLANYCACFVAVCAFIA